MGGTISVSVQIEYAMFNLQKPLGSANHRSDQSEVHPPSTIRAVPVMYAEASEAKKTTAPLRSSWSSMRPMGQRLV